MRLTMLAMAGLVLVSQPVLAQQHEQSEGQAQPTCAAKDTSLPPEMAAWTQRADLASAKGASDLAKAALVPGHAATVSLQHTPDVTYALRPAKPGGSVSYGGLLALDITEAGTYRVGLSSGAWVDLIQDKNVAQATAHGPGPACSSLRKIVDFDLKPGQTVIQLSANADPTIVVMVWQRK